MALMSVICTTLYCKHLEIKLKKKLWKKKEKMKNKSREERNRHIILKYIKRWDVKKIFLYKLMGITSECVGG